MKTFIRILTLVVISINFIQAQTMDNWYILSLGGKPVGYYHESIEYGGFEAKFPVQVRSFVHMSIRISRLGAEASLESKQAFAEDEQGNLLALRSDLLYSKQVSTSQAEVKPGNVHITNESGGKKSFNDVPFSGSLCGGQGIRLLTLKHLINPGDSISYQVFMPEFGMVVKGTRKYTANENLELNGKTINAIKVTDTYNGLPTVRESWLDKEGFLLKSAEPNPFGQMTLLLADETTALAIASMKIELSEDQYAATIARANVRLPQSRMLESITLKIKQTKPGMGLPDFAGSYQRVIEKSKDYVILTVSKPELGEIKEPLSATRENEYLESNFFINKDDTVAQRRVRQIVGTEKDNWKKVVLIRDWVNKNMKFNTGISMAPSTEVLRNLEGTCVSFATLTTTLCRAAQVPARYLMGFVYAEGMWGGHAWVEVYVKDSWIPIDAAMPSQGTVADAARFFFSRTSVKNGLGECMIGGSQLYSNVVIETIDYTFAGEKFQVAPKVYDVTSDGYRNSGLGLFVRTINGFVFNSFNKVYPESILFSMDNPNTGQSIKLYHDFITPHSDLEAKARYYAKDIKNLEKTEYKGSMALKGKLNDHAVLAIANGSDVFVFVTSGTAPDETLQKVLKGFTFRKF